MMCEQGSETSSPSGATVGARTIAILMGSGKLLTKVVAVVYKGESSSDSRMEEPQFICDIISANGPAACRQVIESARAGMFGDDVWMDLITPFSEPLTTNLRQTDKGKS